MSTSQSHRRPGSLGRRLALVVVAAAAMVGLATPAHAIGSPGAIEPRVVCASGSITIAPFVSVQNGYVNGQYVSYRYHLTSSRGHNITSGWSSPQWIPFNTTSYGATTSYGTSALAQSRLSAMTGTIWDVHVQVAFWNPNAAAYSYSGWAGPVAVTNLPNAYTAAHLACRT